jgi:phage terminase large subunit-like protein
VVQSWDTALTDTPGSCFSVCITIGIIEDKYEVRKAILLNVWKDRVEYPELRHIAQRMFMNYRDTVVNFSMPIPDSPMKADQVIVEEKVNGFCLLADFRRAGINAVGFNPNRYGKKVVRARLASALIQGGAFLLPCKDYDDGIVPTPYAAKLISECALYTGQDGESNDVVDSLSQALIYMNERGLIYNQGDPYIGKKDNEINRSLNKHLEG